jgi:hypothetical protein
MLAFSIRVLDTPRRYLLVTKVMTRDQTMMAVQTSDDITPGVRFGAILLKRRRRTDETKKTILKH